MTIEPQSEPFSGYLTDEERETMQQRLEAIYKKYNETPYSLQDLIQGRTGGWF